MSRPFFTAGAILGVMLTGCSQPRAALRLEQSEIDGPQQVLRLSSDRAWCRAGGGGEGRGETNAVLLEFPLPGSRLGDAQYLVYMRIPFGQGTYAVGDALNEGEALRGVVSGLLIQRAGRLRGMTAFSRGFVTVEKVSPLVVRLDVACADQTVVRGSFRAAEGVAVLERFEVAHRVDIDLAERVGMRGRNSGSNRLGADGAQAQTD